MSRVGRKDEHIVTALRLAKPLGTSGFKDVSLVHNSLPEISRAEISPVIRLLGKRLAAPLVINAITGGGPLPERINEALATAARETGIAMAVGSQTVAVESPEYSRSFMIARKINPGGLLMANIGANASVETALRAVDMIEADALQVHLNAPQELVMQEGERNFRGWLNNIAEIIMRVQVPVIVKEVGFGISRGAAKRLNEIGVECFDVGGSGGTNFIAIEGLRSERRRSCLESWGIPTVASIVEIESIGINSSIIATGGVNNGLDVAKALALGVEAAGIAGTYLKTLMEEKVAGLISVIENTKADLINVMHMVGAASPGQLRQVPLVITGRTGEWLRERGIETAKFARRDLF